MHMCCKRSSKYCPLPKTPTQLVHIARKVFSSVNYFEPFVIVETINSTFVAQRHLDLKIHLVQSHIAAFEQFIDHRHLKVPQVVANIDDDCDSEDDGELFPNDRDRKDFQMIYGSYCEAIAILERHKVQTVHDLIDRRTFEHVLQKYNDH